jgi:hypothetical protein
MNPKPLTPEEVSVAAEQFFPLFEIVRTRMPEGSTTEDTLKVMESICGLAQKLRTEEEKIKFGFNKNETPTNTQSTDVG